MTQKEYHEMSQEILKEIEDFTSKVAHQIPHNKIPATELFIIFEVICNLVGLQFKQVYSKERFELLKTQTESMEEKDMNGCLNALRNPDKITIPEPQKKIH